MPETIEPVLSQPELDVIIQNLIIMNENLQLINEKQQETELALDQMLRITENLELINLKIEGEFDDNGVLLEIPTEETNFFIEQAKMEEIYVEAINQTSLLSELSTSQINQEPYRYDHVQKTNEHLITLSEQMEGINTTVQGTSDITFLSHASIITYATVFLPLIAIIAMLWWFFKNFLTRFR